MKNRFAVICYWFFVVMLPSAAMAQNSSVSGQSMVFAVGYGNFDQKPDNYVLIGTYVFTADSVKAEFKEFDANADLKPLKGNLRQGLKAPYGRKACEDKAFDIPRASSAKSVVGGWRGDDKTLTISIGSMVLEWELDDPKEHAYKLRSLRDNVANREYPLAVGFAYISNVRSMPAQLKKANFLPIYRGDIYHKNNLAGPQTPWEQRSSGLKVSVFEEAQGGDALLYSSVGTAESNGAWVGNGIFLNAENKAPYTIYEDLGHDFNKNGCYDEFGHNKVMFAAFDEGSPLVRKMIYIEYSYTFDGFPMLSVGRYYQ